MEHPGWKGTTWSVLRAGGSAAALTSGCAPATCPANTVEIGGGACVFYDSDDVEVAFCFENPDANDDALERANPVAWVETTDPQVYSTALGSPRDVDYFEVAIPEGCEATLSVDRANALDLAVARAPGVQAQAVGGRVTASATSSQGGVLTVRITSAEVTETGCVAYELSFEGTCP